MRVLCVVLLGANLVLAAYALLLGDASNSDTEQITQQLNADQVRTIAPRAPVAAPRRKAACIEWGSFGDAELAVARRALEPLQLGQRASEVRVPVIANWWVYIPPLKDGLAVERKVAELEARGVTDYFAVEAAGPLNNAISLGVFRSEESANAFLQSLRAKGVRSAQLGNREHRFTQTTVLVREPDPQTAARLAGLAVQFPGTELKALECPS